MPWQTHSNPLNHIRATYAKNWLSDTYFTGKVNIGLAPEREIYMFCPASIRLSIYIRKVIRTMYDGRPRAWWRIRPICLLKNFIATRLRASEKASHGDIVTTNRRTHIGELCGWNIRFELFIWWWCANSGLGAFELISAALWIMNRAMEADGFVWHIEKPNISWLRWINVSKYSD